MNIKSLLLGSAAALVAATGARAADAIVIAEPEPMEYVRICDMYGAGFFYIPGTETCLSINGFVRYEMGYNSLDWTNAGGGTEGYRYWNFARFRMNVDTRNETEWGTLRGFARGQFDWVSQSWTPLPATATGGSNVAYLDHAFIELQQSMGTLRIGKTDTPYARFLGYGSSFGPYDGSYAFANSSELSYTFTGGNGFSAIIAAVESGSGLFEPRVEGGVNFRQGWGSVGAIVGYDTPANNWGAKAVARVNFGMVELGAHVFYASGLSAYHIAGLPAIAGVPGYNSGASEWSALGHARVNVSENLAVQASAQWFDANYSIVDDYWQIAGGLDWSPVNGLNIKPEIRYTTGVTVGGVPIAAENDVWEARIRFDRSF